MREAFKLVYRFKIRTMFYFGLGYGEVSNLVSLVKDVAIILGFLALVLHWQITLKQMVCLGIVSFLGFVALGILLKKSGMSDYATKTSNSINPELKKINAIAKHLGVDNE